MSLECGNCGHAGNVVYYRRPKDKPKHLKWLKLSILLAGLFSFTSVFQLVDLVVPLIAAAGQLQATVAANPTDGQEYMQDYVQVYTRAVVLFLFALAATLLTILVRYLLFFIRGFRSGHPRTLVQVRGLAWLQVAVQGLTWLAVAILFAGLQTIHVQPAIGAGFFVALFLLWFTRRPALLEYFSWHKVEPIGDRGAAPAPQKQAKPATPI